MCVSHATLLLKLHITRLDTIEKNKEQRDHKPDREIVDCSRMVSHSTGYIQPTPVSPTAESLCRRCGASGCDVKVLDCGCHFHAVSLSVHFHPMCVGFVLLLRESSLIEIPWLVNDGPEMHSGNGRSRCHTMSGMPPNV